MSNIAFPELLSAAKVGAFLGVSRSEAYELARDELLPAPVKLNSEMRWRTRELIDWIDAGLPRRDDWRWRPSLPAKLDDLIQRRTKELASLQGELDELKERRAAGDTHAHIRRHD